jgi:SSS family solute:Na+ symporter
MNSLDWGVVSLYVVAMIAMSVYLGRGQRNQEDYYVGGRDMPWWAVGLSTMATQTSAISFISIPAYVALKPGGGLTWLQYELAVPLAMIAVTVLLLPFFRKLQLISVYEYLELRFGPSVRTLLSAVFLLSRALGTGVGLYASAIVLTAILGIPLWTTIVVMGIVTIIYDTIGGIKAVIYSDVIQTFVLLGGIFLCIGFAVADVGGVDKVLQALPEDRWRTLDMSTGLGDGSSAPFWGFLVGGFFLYMAYYGADQSQVQRELSASSVEDTRRSLYLNGFARFPLTVLYMILGLALGAVYVNSPQLQAEIPSSLLDFLVPVFILQYLPAGVRGILVAALLAAAMSSLDSALNSLSAATMRDFVEKRRKLTEKGILLWSKITTVLWGLVITGFAFVVGGIADTVIESINKIGSAFYGPILAAFLVGVLSERATTRGIFSGVLAGVGLNLGVWILYPDVFWMWWNLFGLLVAVAVTIGVSLFTPARPVEEVRPYTLFGSGFFKEERLWFHGHLVLVVYFFAMLGVLWLIDHYGAALFAG